ncbi:hypothetical protein B296_00018695 [Ensete ventricosum]|uniref:Uncharacterized protein n=1 Tax=Ensete ventricosum TaxID=4639 RepID=A0A427ASG7_ENSVE|nr:hypothetical protein B296_00018695 [Ensete ventricosum]
MEPFRSNPTPTDTRRIIHSNNTIQNHHRKTKPVKSKNSRTRKIDPECGGGNTIGDRNQKDRLPHDRKLVTGGPIARGSPGDGSGRGSLRHGCGAVRGVRRRLLGALGFPRESGEEKGAVVAKEDEELCAL